jgi:LDH2 family malate/lactate/ureidoglycolate dehydrogenase
MNLEPEDAVWISHEELKAFMVELCQCHDMSNANAELLSSLLVEADLIGNFSHGSAIFRWYANFFSTGKLNPNPNVTVVKETPVSLLVDGDYGLGYYALHEGTLKLIEKVKESGIGVLVTRNHEHIGAAGHYARMVVDHDMTCFVTSGHQLNIQNMDWNSAMRSAGGSPMCFGAPAGKFGSFILDFGTVHQINNHMELFREHAPGILFRHMGLGQTCQIWGGLLAGLPVDPADNPRLERSPRQLEQGAMMILMRIDLFIEPDAFKKEMEAYVEMVESLKPIAGAERTTLPGVIEAERKVRYLEKGIPLSGNHRGALERIADEHSIATPW